MTKKEQAAFDTLRRERDMYKAFRWYDPVPPDIGIPTGYARTKGWIAYFTFGSHLSSAGLKKASSSQTSHRIGDDAWSEERSGHGSQRGIELHLHPADAIRNQQHIVCRQFAEAMATLNRQIEELEKKVELV